MFLVKKPGNPKGVFTFLVILLPMSFFLLSSALSPDELKNRTKLTDANELQFLNLIHVGEPFI